MKLIRYSDLAVLPWKNGAGIRRDLAKGNVTLKDSHDVNWLASISDLNEDVQFSSYPGMIRWFLPISKGWLTLNIERHGSLLPVELSEISPAHQFQGEEKVFCALHDGPMKALNIFSNSDQSVASFKSMSIIDTTWLTLRSNGPHEVSFLLVTNGVCRVSSDAWSGPVVKLNSLLNDSGEDETFEISPVEASEIVVVTIKLAMSSQGSFAVPG
jgi:environmental stress-induced protein Ves